MRQLLTQLYVTSEDAYLSLDGENVVVSRQKTEIGRVPLHTLEGIVCFSRSGASPALMGKCAAKGIDLCFFSPYGQFLARTVGEERGNVLLRQTQYRISDSEALSCRYARYFILGKVYNARWVLERATRAAEFLESAEKEYVAGLAAPSWLVQPALLSITRMPFAIGSPFYRFSPRPTDLPAE